MTTTPPDAPAEDTGPRPSRDEIRDLGRLRRSVHDRKVAGVAGGLARHLDIDPVILRVAFVVLTFFGGAGLIVYGACWLLVPEEGSGSAPVQLDDKSRTVALIVIGVIAALALVGDSWGAYWFPWPLAIIGLVAFVWLSRTGRGRGGTAGAPAGTPGHGVPAYGAAAAPATAPSVDPSPDGTVEDTGTGVTNPTEATTEPGQQYGPETRQYAGQYGAPGSPYDTGYGGPGGYQGDYQAPYVAPAPRDPRKRGPKLFWFTLALIAFSEGVLGIVDLAGVPIVDSAYAALAVGVIGVMLLVGSVIGRAGGLIFLGLIASLILTGATVADRWDGETRLYDPVSSADVDDSYYLEAGEQVLDLSEVSDLEELDGRTIEISGEVGAIDVIVPEDVDVRVNADIDGPGGYDLFGDTGGGIGWRESRSHEGSGDTDVATIVIDANLEVGEITAETAP